MAFYFMGVYDVFLWPGPYLARAAQGITLSTLPQLFNDVWGMIRRHACKILQNGLSEKTFKFKPE